MLQTVQLRTSSECGPDHPCQGTAWWAAQRIDGQHSAGMGRALALQQEKATVLLHGDTEAEPQVLWLNLQPHPEVFFLNLINHESNLNSTIFLS